MKSGQRLHVKCMSDLADIRRLDTSALALTEGHIQGKLDGQTRHCSSGQGLNLGHSLNQSSFGAVSLQGHLQLCNRKVSSIRNCKVAQQMTKNITNIPKNI